MYINIYIHCKLRVLYFLYYSTKNVHGITLNKDYPGPRVFLPKIQRFSARNPLIQSSVHPDTKTNTENLWTNQSGEGNFPIQNLQMLYYKVS